MTQAPLTHHLNIASSMLSTLLRGGIGVITTPAATQPVQALQLYEFEGCPYCRLVREALTELDLDAMILPCPKGGKRHRGEAVAHGGREQFPFLFDPNTGRRLYESDAIVSYLFETYAGTPLPLHWQMSTVHKIGSAMATLPRLGRGTQAQPSRRPAQPLELYSFEASPFARPVRERLCQLELPYLLRTVGRRSAADWIPPQLRKQFAGAAEPGTRNRRALLERAGTISIPYLVDPNTGTELAESADIIAYLDRTYAL